MSTKERFLQAFFDNLRGKGLYPAGFTVETVSRLETVVLKGLEAKLSAEHLAYVLATPYHEVGRTFELKTENLNYTSASRIRSVWPTRFPNINAANPYVRNPQGLANFVYNGRMKNRVGSNDGWAYRGRGWPQITGRDNYERYGIANNPEDALDPKVSAHILVNGMVNGRFTGKKLSDYNLPAQYREARAIINADVAANGSDIARIANQFLTALRAGFATGYDPTDKEPEPIIEPGEPIEPVEPEEVEQSEDPFFLIHQAISLLVQAQTLMRNKKQ